MLSRHGYRHETHRPKNPIDLFIPHFFTFAAPFPYTWELNRIRFHKVSRFHTDYHSTVYLQLARKYDWDWVASGPWTVAIQCPFKVWADTDHANQLTLNAQHDSNSDLQQYHQALSCSERPSVEVTDLRPLVSLTRSERADSLLIELCTVWVPALLKSPQTWRRIISVLLFPFTNIYLKIFGGDSNLLVILVPFYSDGLWQILSKLSVG